MGVVVVVVVAVVVAAVVVVAVVVVVVVAVVVVVVVELPNRRTTPAGKTATAVVLLQEVNVFLCFWKAGESARLMTSAITFVPGRTRVSRPLDATSRQCNDRTKK